MNCSYKPSDFAKSISISHHFGILQLILEKIGKIAKLTKKKQAT